MLFYGDELLIASLMVFNFVFVLIEIYFIDGISIWSA